MQTLKELLAQREAIEAQISEARTREFSDAVAKIHALINEYGLTQADLFGGATGPDKVRGKAVSAKYRDPITGATWTGRGRAPRWMRGKEKTTFLIP